MLGNIQFIGHLYKQALLTEKIMHACIRQLLVCNGLLPNLLICDVERCMRACMRVGLRMCVRVCGMAPKPMHTEGPSLFVGGRALLPA